jgi:hypothetical protein
MPIKKKKVTTKKTTSSITIRYAEMNGRPVSKKIKTGTTVDALAEKLKCKATDLFVNGKKVGGKTKLTSKSFVVLVTKVKGG